MNSKLRLLAILAILPFLFLTQSCEKIKDLAAFDTTVDLPAETITLDSNAYKSSDDLLEWNILKEYFVDVDLQKILDDNDVSSADFTNGRVDTYTATLVYPPGVTFSFMDQMKVSAAINPNFTDEVDVAMSLAFDPSTTTITFEAYDIDITSFIKSEAGFYLRVWGRKTTELPVPSVEINLEGKVKVRVEPI